MTSPPSNLPSTLPDLTSILKGPSSHFSPPPRSHEPSPPKNRRALPRSRSPSPYSKRASCRTDDNERNSPKYRSRSRSPGRKTDDRRPKKPGTGGFKWKDTSRRDEEDGRQDIHRLERGYREQEPRRYRPTSRERDNGPRNDIEAKFGRQRSPAGKGGDNVKDKFGDSAGAGAGGDPPPPKKKKKSTAEKPIVTSQEMIIVNVNDRLGTKTAVPCLASDPISM